jgi:PAS domain S-box-containing protein
MDVTEQEQMRQAASLREARLRTLTDSPAIWLWEQDEEFRFTLLTEDQQQTHRPGHAGALGRCRWEVPDAEPIHGTWKEHQELLHARRAFQNFEYRVTSGRSTRFLSTSGVPLFADDGRFLGYRGIGHDITALKQAQANAQESQALLRLATRLGRVGAWAVELPAQNVSCSSEFLAIHELDHDAQLTVEFLTALIHPDSQERYGRAIDACVSDGTAFDVELQAFTSTHKLLWIRLIGEAVRGQDGRLRRVQGAVQDITQSRQAAEHLRRLSQELTTTLESIADGFLMIAYDGRLTYVNLEAERLLGRSRSKLVGAVIWEEMPSLLGSPLHEEFQRACEERTAGRREGYAAAFGKWCGISAYPSEHGVALYFRDVTDSREARMALLESEERYRLLFQGGADAIVEASAEGRILRANPAACAMFGRSQEAMCSLESRHMVWPGETRLQAMIEKRRTLGSARGELTMIRSDGACFESEVATSTYSTRDGAVRTNIVIRDITERLQFRDKILALNAELGERVRQRTRDLELANNELQGFAHALAHDLRTPIATIKGFGGPLEDVLATSGNSKARHYTSRIKAAAQQMDDYVEALLSLAQTSQSKLAMTQVDLSMVAAAVLDELQDQDSARRVNRNIQDGLRVSGDARLLRMLLQNLLGNAWKFTRHVAAAQISFTARAGEQGEVVYCVRDNGAGFDMAWAGKLFASFQRLHTESEFEGTGIGLANAHRVVTRHGGRIWAESAVGQGAAFSFTLGGAEVAGGAS